MLPDLVLREEGSPLTPHGRCDLNVIKTNAKTLLALINDILDLSKIEAGRVDTARYLRERPGMSAFVIEDGAVHHTYSTYGRGLDILWGAYQWLDRAPKGRNEQNPWWKRHDEYETKGAP